MIWIIVYKSLVSRFEPGVKVEVSWHARPYYRCPEFRVPDSLSDESICPIINSRMTCTRCHPHSCGVALDETRKVATKMPKIQF